ncbi:hypothetical protein [Mucilaginibacter pedocola]|nr:hypothetical protein [Mucilaginibacter pedocola]
MKYLKILCLLIAMTHFAAITTAQESINTEVFKSSFKPTATGGDICYNGKKHSFRLRAGGKKITLAAPKGQQDNQMYLQIDGVPFQASLVPLPQQMLGSVRLENLTYQQQREILEGYVKYEIDYLENELKMKLSNMRKEWVYINNRLYYIWRFEANYGSVSSQVVKPVVAQVYYSTVCFNQVLDLNRPVFKGDDVNKVKGQIDKIATTLRLYSTAKPPQI